MPPPSPITVLLIDDDTQHLQLQARALSKAGFRAITTVVGSNTVGFHENERPDVIVLDYRLNSSLTAAQVASLIKQTFPNKPIIVMSGLPEMPQDIAPLAAAFLHKDKNDELVATILSLLDMEATA